MRNRERFNANVDEYQEQNLSKRITEVKKIIKKLSVHLHDTVAIIEPCEHMLVWGSLRRCLICIESGVMLVSQGYVGSANALFRQMLEFLMWSKLGLSCDEKTLVKINSYFYDESFGKSHPVTDILKKTKIEDVDDEITGKELTTWCKKVYHNYSFVTHATSLAQQIPYKIDCFYQLIYSCLNEICLMLDVFLCVYKQYCEKVIKIYRKTNKETTIDAFSLNIENVEERKFDFLWAAATHSGTILPKIARYHNTLKETQDDFSSGLQLVFCSTWIVDGKNI